MKIGAAGTPPAKEQVRQLLERIPDDASLEDIQYHIYVREKIERGHKDVEAGRLLTEEEFDKRMARWLKQ
jgi:predicted transcriptional regulator